MSEAEFDFAVFGATPLAHLLAGVLAHSHGRRVLLVGESQARYRLPRGIDLSVAPMTRPESWAMLAQGLPEATRLVARIAGRQALSRHDPIFFARGPRDIEALSHIRHMAQGFGIAAEAVAPSVLGEGRSGTVLRDAVRINRPVLEAGLKRWLDRGGVRRIAPQKVTIETDGRTEVLSGGTAYSAHQAVLADDEAVMNWLPLRQWPPLLRRLPFASILTTPTQPLAASVMLEFNSGTFLIQQAEGGIAAFGPGDLAGFSAHVQALLGRERQVEQAGQTGFQALLTLDGAPVFGRAAGVGADVVAGLGCAGAFLAPALGRWLTGKASAGEAAWFEARLVNRSGKSAPVDDYAPGSAGLPA
ncbi:FAD-binding oxidoreductase/lyase [Devosia sp. CAU 1758]